MTYIVDSKFEADIASFRARSEMVNVLWGLISHSVIVVLTLFFTWLYRRWRQRKRIAQLRATASSDEIAVCVRIGGSSDPMPDVVHYLRSEMPAVKVVAMYSAPPDAELADPKTADRVIEDIFEGLGRFIGEGRLTRVHFFPVGILAYSSAPMAMLSNWCPIRVYHRSKGYYIPLFEISPETRNRRCRLSAALGSWNVADVRDQI